MKGDAATEGRVEQASYVPKASRLGARGSRLRGRMEKELLAQGVRCAGVDEVGRGCLAGPVTAACVVLDVAKVAKLPYAERLLLKDSKQLTTVQRKYMLPRIREVSVACEIGFASVEEIERIGILQATFLAMRRAMNVCRESFDLLLVDGKLKVAGWDGEQRPLVKGDNLCWSIAAASILAKEARDDYMREQAKAYPGYGFDEHVGYGTKQHLARIKKQGICPLHRRNFDPIRPYDPSFVSATYESAPLFD